MATGTAGSTAERYSHERGGMRRCGDGAINCAVEVGHGDRRETDLVIRFPALGGPRARGSEWLAAGGERQPYVAVPYRRALYIGLTCDRLENRPRGEAASTGAEYAR